MTNQPSKIDPITFTKQIRDLGALCLSFINHKAIIEVCKTNPQGVEVQKKLSQELKNMISAAEKLLDSSQKPDLQTHENFFLQAIALFDLNLNFIKNEGVVRMCDYVEKGKDYRDGLEKALIDILARYDLLKNSEQTYH